MNTLKRFKERLNNLAANHQRDEATHSHGLKLKPASREGKTHNPSKRLNKNESSVENPNKLEENKDLRETNLETENTNIKSQKKVPAFMKIYSTKLYRTEKNNQSRSGSRKKLRPNEKDFVKKNKELVASSFRGTTRIIDKILNF